MKKIITLMLLIGGFVCTASATTLHVGIEIANYAGTVTIHRYGGSTPDNWDNGGAATTFDGLKYGRFWYSVDMNGNTGAVIRVSDGQSFNIENISGDHFYAYMSGSKTWESGDNYGKYPAGHLTEDYNKWENGLTCRNNIAGNWGSTTSDMIRDSENSDLFTYTLTPSQIGANTEITFRLKQNDYVPLNTSGGAINGYPQIYPTTDGVNNCTDLDIATPTTTYDNYVWEDNNNRVWKITVPSYTYESIVISAEYVNDGSYKWKISADAYLPAVTTNPYGYCTYVNPVALTITDAKAYYAEDKNNGSAKAVEMTNPAANTPMLIKGTASTNYSFKVAASGSDNPGTGNAFKAGTGDALTSPANGPYCYILKGDAFYLANNNVVASNKAYLQLSSPATARPLVFSDNEETGINVVATSDDYAEATYNLKGQRVATPSKGLYIVNGRKVIMK